LNCDAYHALRPTKSGVGLVAAIKEALVEAKLTPSNIDCFNCHATSTPVGDAAEASSIKNILLADKAL
jgi:3-oxoacyl-[acyl-carrier-protein] synthase II